MARIVGISVDEIDVPGDLGQPGEQGIAVPVAPADGRLVTSAGKGPRQYAGEPQG